MTTIDHIKKYINGIEPQEAIFSDDIYNYVKKKVPDIDRATFNTNMQRYEKTDDLFIRYQKGVYYKTVKTPFGKANINMLSVIKRMYVTDGKEIFGYETGPSYMNKIGLTTQLPKLTYIATDKARYSTTDKEKGVVFKKPVIEINKNNYRYLQLLDALENKEGVAIEAEDHIGILKNQIEKYRLDFEMLLGYARYYNNIKVYNGLAMLVRGVR